MMNESITLLIESAIITLLTESGLNLSEMLTSIDVVRLQLYREMMQGVTFDKLQECLRIIEEHDACVREQLNNMISVNSL